MSLIGATLTIASCIPDPATVPKPDTSDEPAATDSVDSDTAATDTGGQPKSAGDVDADGYADVHVDAPQDLGGNGGGAAYLLHGPFLGIRAMVTAEAVFRAEDDVSGAGAGLAGAGDVDGNGLDDVLVGAVGCNGCSGSTYLLLSPLSGEISLADAYLQIDGGYKDEAGRFLAGVGDVDGDGLDDILIGGLGDDDGGEDAGAAWLVLGASML